jgi:hypothetical protein
VRFAELVKGGGVSPFADQCLDKTFCFSVGAGPVWPGETTSDAQLITGVAKGTGTIATAVVGQDSLNPHAQRLVILHGKLQKRDGGRVFGVRMREKGNP